jgi:hypothetical protein
MGMERQQVVDRIVDAVRAEYVFADKGTEAARALLSANAAGELSGGEVEEWCASVTRVLQSATDDLHLRLVHHEDAAPDPKKERGYASYWREQAAKTAGGVRSVERLSGNIAVVTLGPFIGLPVYGGAWLSAAMNMCRGADAVVLDLRDCVGGTPDGAALVCSYLFGPEPVHLIDVEDRAGVRQFWTLTVVPGARLGPSVPLAILTSKTTFSGGEELAFNLQELGRGTVFGEVTRGGAHPRIGVKVEEHLELALPVACPRSPRSGSNWEGVGVRPDVLVPSADALSRACSVLAGTTTT